MTYGLVSAPSDAVFRLPVLLFPWSKDQNFISRHQVLGSKLILFNQCFRSSPGPWAIDQELLKSSRTQPMRIYKIGEVIMKFTVSWWDEKNGIGIAISESGTECVLHKSNISVSQSKQLKPRMIVHGEIKRMSGGVVLIEKLRTSRNFESPASFRKLLSEVAA